MGKFNCKTGEFKLTKDEFILSESLEKNRGHSEDFISLIKANYESYGSDVYNPVNRAEEKYRIRVMRSNCNYPLKGLCKINYILLLNL